MEFVDLLMGFARGAWRQAAPDSVRSDFRPIVTRVLATRALAALRRPEPPFQPGPLIVSGFLKEAKGVSKAAQLTLLGLAEAGFSPIAHDLREALYRPPGRGVLPTDAPGGVWLVHCNAPEAVAVLAAVAPDDWRGRYRIGYWAWELPIAPRSWAGAARLFHEIWAPSAFVAEALRAAGVKQPISVMPHPVALEVGGEEAPQTGSLRLDSTVFRVLAMGDLLSSAARKNLLGAIDIYRAAFPQNDGSAQLIVKSLSGEAHPGFSALAARVSAGRSDIVFVTEHLSAGAVGRLIASSDVLLSPHRSEGFGLTLAEALMVGVPPLATGWSGNLDFMTGAPGLLIGYDLRPVDDRYGVYKDKRQVWAEPRSDDAVQKLRALFASPDLRRRLAAQAREAVLAQAQAWRPERFAGTLLERLAKAQP